MGSPDHPLPFAANPPGPHSIPFAVESQHSASWWLRPRQLAGGTRVAAPSRSRESPEQQSLRLHMKPVGSQSPPAPPPKRPPPLSPGPSLAQTALCPPSPRAPAQQLLCLPGGQEGKSLPAGAQPPQGALCQPTGLLAAHSFCFQPNLVTPFQPLNPPHGVSWLWGRSQGPGSSRSPAPGWQTVNHPGCRLPSLCKGSGREVAGSQGAASKSQRDSRATC